MTSTIDPAEIARFSAIAAQWWDTSGKFAPLHRLNAARLSYLNAQISGHFARTPAGDGQSATPLRNLSLLDVGCGGGLIAEPMARLGASVTGIDASAQSIAVAGAHAAQSGLAIDYRTATAEELATRGLTFDVVLALEIVEHVAEPDAFYDALGALVRPGGLLILSTLNRTPQSYVMAILGAEHILRWLPVGTHSWRKFIRPSEMAAALRRRGLAVRDICGISFSPTRWEFTLTPNRREVNYLLSAERPAA